MILPTTWLSYSCKKGNTPDGLIISGLELEKSELTYGIRSAKKQFNIEQMKPDEVQMYLSLIDESFGSHKWSEDILECEKYFPEADSLASLDFAGDIYDERLDEIINKEENCDEDTLYYIINALFLLKNPRFKEIAFFVCNNEEYAVIWEDVYSLLSKIKDEDIESFFIEFLINDEKLRPRVTKIVDDYFLDIYS